MLDVTGIPALDVAIGLSFIFFLLSLAATAVMEFIASGLELRARTLEKGLRNMLVHSTPAPPETAAAQHSQEVAKLDLLDRLYNHPMIQSLYKQGLGFWRTKVKIEGQTKQKRARPPSYISPRSFAEALFDTIAPDVLATDRNGHPRPSADVIADTRRKIEKLPIPTGVEHRLLMILDSARGDIDAFRLGLETWFDDVMARVSGWYKRQTQLIIVVLAIVLTGALNVNTITVGERLWRDPVLRESVVQQASGAAGKAQGATARDRLNNAVANVEQVRKVGVPIGWSQQRDDPRRVTFTGWGWARQIGGWLLTILAVSLGAPFWFDTLSRLSRLRGSGKPEAPRPASSGAKPSDRGTPAPALAIQVAAPVPPAPPPQPSPAARHEPRTRFWQRWF